MYTLGTAAKATGKAKSTISKALKEGTISGLRQEDGSFRIDPAELHRVFPPVSANSQIEPQSNDLEPSDLRFKNGQLKGELKQIHEQLTGIETMHERERKALADQIEDLKRRLDQSEAERRDKDRQLTALLTDQRPKEIPIIAETPLSSPENIEIKPTNQVNRSGLKAWLHRITG